MPSPQTIREKTLAKGEKLSFEYSVVVPAEVGYNAVGYSNYVVYYKIDTQNYSNQCWRMHNEVST